MSKELDAVFERLLGVFPSWKDNRRCADRMLDGGSLYRFNRAVLYVTVAPAKSDMEDGVPLPLSDGYGLLTARADKLRPEVVFMEGGVCLSKEDRETLSALGEDLYLIPSPDSRNEALLFCRKGVGSSLHCVVRLDCPGLVCDRFRCRPYRMSAETFKCMTAAGISSVRLRSNRLGGAAVLELKGRDGTIFAFLECDSREEALSEVHVGDRVFHGFGWSAESLSFKKLEIKRRTRMNGLVNPVKQVSEPVPAPEPESAVEEVPVPVREVKEPVPEDAPDAQPAKQARQTRKAASCLTPADYHRLTESLGAPVSVDVDSFDAAQEETRALRDMVIAASRRMANLSIALHKVARESVDKYSAIQKLMVGR